VRLEVLVAQRHVAGVCFTNLSEKINLVH
jgi:hypothetical protein